MIFERIFPQEQLSNFAIRGFQGLSLTSEFVYRLGHKFCARNTCFS